jgi:hypothetical protein
MRNNFAMAIRITPQTLSTSLKNQLNGLLTSDGILIPSFSSLKDMITTQLINENWQNIFIENVGNTIWKLPNKELEAEVRFFLNAIDKNLTISTLDFFTKLTNPYLAKAWFYSYNPFFFGITTKLLSYTSQNSQTKLCNDKDHTNHVIAITANRQIIFKTIIDKIKMFKSLDFDLNCYICGKHFSENCEHIKGIPVRIEEILVLDPTKKAFILNEILISGPVYLEPYLTAQFGVNKGHYLDPNHCINSVLLKNTARFSDSRTLHNLRQTYRFMATYITWSSINKKLSIPNPSKIFHLRSCDDREIILANNCKGKQFLYSINLFLGKIELLFGTTAYRKYHYEHNLQRLILHADDYIQNLIKIKETDTFIAINIIKYPNCGGIKKILPFKEFILLSFHVPILHLLSFLDPNNIYPITLGENQVILDVFHVKKNNVLILTSTITLPQKKNIYLLQFDSSELSLIDIPTDGMLNQLAMIQNDDENFILIQNYGSKIVIHYCETPTNITVVNPISSKKLEIAVRQMIATFNNKVVMVEIGKNEKDILSIWSINATGQLVREKSCCTRFAMIQDITYMVKYNKLSILCLGKIEKYCDVTDYYLQGFDEDISFT